MWRILVVHRQSFFKITYSMVTVAWLVLSRYFVHVQKCICIRPGQWHPTSGRYREVCNSLNGWQEALRGFWGSAVCFFASSFTLPTTNIQQILVNHSKNTNISLATTCCHMFADPSLGACGWNLSFVSALLDLWSHSRSRLCVLCYWTRWRWCCVCCQVRLQEKWTWVLFLHKNEFTAVRSNKTIQNKTTLVSKVQ